MDDMQPYNDTDDMQQRRAAAQQQRPISSERVAYRRQSGGGDLWPAHTVAPAAHAPVPPALVLL
jgi:hypothetical protein